MLTKSGLLVALSRSPCDLLVDETIGIIARLLVFNVVNVVVLHALMLHRVPIVPRLLILAMNRQLSYRCQGSIL